MRKPKLSYVQRTYEIDELLVQLDAICEDDGKEISDYSQNELVEEAWHCLDVLKDDLRHDYTLSADDCNAKKAINYTKKQIRLLKKYIDDFS